MQVIVIIGVIILSTYFGVKRGHNPVLWFLLSLFFPFSIIYCIRVLFFKTDKKDKSVVEKNIEKIINVNEKIYRYNGYTICPECGEEFKINGDFCPYCNKKVF